MPLPRRDIHCHILPGVDDGFGDESSSLEALKRLSAAGVEEVVFTPHLNPDVYPEGTEAHMRGVYEQFAPKIPAELGLKTSLAAEYMIVKDFEERASDPSLLTWEDGSILVEMSYYYPSTNLETALFELNLAGRKPILAHPERYLYLSDNLHAFDKYRDMGCRFQCNLMSLSGTYGKHSVKILEYLLKNGMYDFLASDLHSLHQLDAILASLGKWKVRRLLRKFL